ncbi:MAG: hypothetical protein ACLR7D_06230 [Lachnospira eligens]
MDLKLEKEEFAELINRTFIENVSVQSSDNSGMLLYQRAEERSCSRLCRSLRKVWTGYMDCSIYDWWRIQP